MEEENLLEKILRVHRYMCCIAAIVLVISTIVLYSWPVWTYSLSAGDLEEVSTAVSDWETAPIIDITIESE